MIDVTLKRDRTEKLVISEDVDAISGDLVVDPRNDVHLQSTIDDFCQYHGNLFSIIDTFG